MTEATLQSDRVARLWLSTLHEIARRAAHDVKNALNGVAVNLEVARSRLERPNAAVDGVVRFAVTASQQFERVTAYTEALLALARPARDPADVPALLRGLAPLVESLGSGELGAVLTTPPPGTHVSRADAQASRLALAAALLAAADRGDPVRCRADAGEGGALVVHVAGGGGSAPELPPEVAEVVVDAGIRLDRENDELTLTFPPLDARAE